MAYNKVYTHVTVALLNSCHLIGRDTTQKNAQYASGDSCYAAVQCSIKPARSTGKAGCPVCSMQALELLRPYNLSFALLTSVMCSYTATRGHSVTTLSRSDRALSHDSSSESSRLLMASATSVWHFLLLQCCYHRYLLYWLLLDTKFKKSRNYIRAVSAVTTHTLMQSKCKVQCKANIPCCIM